MTTMISVGGAMLFFVGILVSIALHELGHMIPAKLFGIKVTQYFVGFGKTLWSRRRGETEYGVKVVPAGGFVRIVGMLPPTADGRQRRWSTGAFQSLIDDARSASAEEIGEADQHRAFYRQAWWKKVIVMASGPAVNLLLAVILISISMMVIGVYRSTTTLASVSDCVLPASTTATTCPDGAPASPAKAAGLEPGDRLVSINAVPIASWRDAQDQIRAAAGRTVAFVIDRNGTRIDKQVAVVPNQTPDLNDPAKTVTVGFIGVSPGSVRSAASVGETGDYLGQMVGATLSALWHLPQRMVNVVKAVGGDPRAQDSPMSVVGASRVAGEIATGDIGGETRLIVSDRVALMLSALGGLNLFVGLFNLLPLLPLDGGHIFGALWEAARRGLARLLHRPDPGHVDVAKALPLVYALASVLVVMGGLLMVADIINPVRLG
jgi:membrane-associated protease RseP (regulator of RpoE activity)